jgi:hypothetical protein
MTKGAQGTVAGWHSFEGPAGKTILETLFVRLTDPHKTVKIDGPKENVILIIRCTTAVKCTLPNDDNLSVSRE